MNCERYRLLINKYIDCEIEKEEMDILSRHLEKCEECKLFLFDLQKLQDVSLGLVYKPLRRKRNIKVLALKLLAFLIFALLFKFLSFGDYRSTEKMVRMERKTQQVVEKESRKVYLMDFEFSDNAILK